MCIRDREDIRECKILATLIMPADKMLPEITDLWMEQVQSQEMAETVSYTHLDVYKRQGPSMV